MSKVELFLLTVKNKGVSGFEKKALGIILIAGILLLLPAVVSAEAIGYVDFEFLFYAHPEYDLKNQQLQEKAESCM